MSKPSAQDLSHFLSEESKRRRPSPLKEAFVHFANPNICSLGGGLPLPELFPFDSSNVKALAPPFKQGIDQDILTANETTDVEIFKNTVKHENDIKLASSLQYAQSQGDINLRNFVKEHTELVHDVGFKDWDVVLTAGNTFGWDACLRTFCNTGDVILVEEFAFSSALEATSAHGLTALPVKMDLKGIDPVALEHQLANWSGAKPKLLYTVPTGQNPTGSCLDAERRKAVYKIAQKYDFLIIEDEPYYFLQMPDYDANRDKSDSEHLSHEQFLKSLVPSFLNFDTDGRVLRLDSFSKVLAPGTRIGWIIAQERFVERLLRLIETTMQVASGFSQSLVNGLLQRWGQAGYIDWLIQLRKVYTYKRDVSMDAIYKYFPKDKFEIVAPVAGMFFWIKVDARQYSGFEKLNGDVLKIEEALYEEGLQGGVQLIPGHWFVPRDAPKIDVDETESDKYAMFFRGTFASVPEHELVIAIERWGKVMETLAPTPKN